MREPTAAFFRDLERELARLGSKLSQTYGSAPNVILDICVEMEVWLNRIQELDSFWPAPIRDRVRFLGDQLLKGNPPPDIYNQMIRLMIQASEKLEECRTKRLAAQSFQSRGGLVKSGEGETACVRT